MGEETQLAGASARTAPNGRGGVSRRKLIAGGLGLATASVLSVGEGETAAETEMLPAGEIYGPSVDALWAVIGDVFSERTFYVLGQPQGESKTFAIAVALIRGAILIEGDKPITLSTFGRGDEIMMGGCWEPEGFVAAIIERAYRQFNATIVRVGRNRLDTTEGVLRLTSDTRAGGASYETHSSTGHDGFLAKPLHKLTPGDVIQGIAIRNAYRDGLTAVTIGTLHAHEH